MYLPSILFLLLGGGASAFERTYAPLSDIAKRDVTSCEQTYGAGSVACGTTNGTMCYNPSQGQSCCADSGYCDKGETCAPVAGFCCLQGEDLAACAKNAGFSLPASTPGASPSPATTAATKPTATAPSAPAGGKSAPSETPQVQVSYARKEQWTLLYAGFGIGAVGLFMMNM